MDRRRYRPRSNAKVLTTEARIFGASLTAAVAAARRTVGLVPQDLGVYPKLTARENLDLFGRIYEVPSRRLRPRVAHLLELVGLTARADDVVHTYSGGMKRRLNLASSAMSAERWARSPRSWASVPAPSTGSRSIR